MTVYAIAQISIHDRAACGRYQARFMEVFARYRGRLLAAGESPPPPEVAWIRTHSNRRWKLPAPACWRGASLSRVSRNPARAFRRRR